MANIPEDVAGLLERLASGDTVGLGEFGDNARGTFADEQASLLRDLAWGLRNGTLEKVAA